MKKLALKFYLRKAFHYFRLLKEIGELLEDRVLVVALDDINYLPENVLNEVLMVLLKRVGFKVGSLLLQPEKNL